jgi:hypothetical protein
MLKPKRMNNLKTIYCLILFLPFSFAAAFSQNLAAKQDIIADSLAFINHFKVTMPIIKTPVFKKDTFDIRNFGAKADGLFLNTKSINDAISACSNKGGGVVLIKGGLWLSGPVELKSNVNLHLERDAILLFTPDKSQFQVLI